MQTQAELLREAKVEPHLELLLSRRRRSDGTPVVDPGDVA